MTIDERYFPGCVEPPDPGIYYDVPYSEYERWACFRKSMVSYTLKSAKELYYYVHSENQCSEQTILGSLIDAMLLEHSELDSFVVTPKIALDAKGNEKPWSWQLKYCKQWKAEHEKKGLHVVSSDAWEKAEECAKCVRDHKTAGRWIHESLTQVSLVWQDQQTGIMCKGRIDALHPERIIDLKSTFDIYPENFGRTCARYGYDVGAAAYVDGFSLVGEGPKPFSIIAVSTGDLVDCICYDMYEGNATIMAGEFYWRRSLKRFKTYLENDKIPGYSAVPEEISTPYWHVKVIDEEEE